MNTLKKFLVLGSACISINSHNIANSSNNIVNSNNIINKDLTIGGSLNISRCDTEINSTVTVENTEYDGIDTDLAKLSLGKAPEDRQEDYTIKTINLGNGSILNQTDTGHVHIYDTVNAKKGSTISTSAYDSKHINTMTVNGKQVTKIIDDGTSAGFDIHGDENHNGGYVKFEKGSKITTTSEDPTKYPALYLCNPNSRLNISEILPQKDDDKTVDTKAHIVGTSDENNDRQGTVDIFKDTGDPTSNDYVNNLEDQVNAMRDNDVIIEKIQANLPSWITKVVKVTDPNNSSEIQESDKQELVVTSLESATKTEDENGNIVYNTANGTDIIGSAKIQLVDENGNATEFISGNLLEILKNNYLKNKEGDQTYTYIVKKDGTDTGIKITPQISDLNDLDKIAEVFVPSSNKKESIINESDADERVTLLEFIKSIAPKGEETAEDRKLKLNVYKKADENGRKYHVYNVYLNDRNYTLDLDKFNGNEGNINPLILDKPIDEIPHLNMTSLKDYKDANGNPNNILQIYTNLKGEHPKRWKLPTINNDTANQITEIQLFGNNTKFKKCINLIEGDFDSYVKKILFDRDSFIQTERTTENKSKPITWEFIDSNSNVNQGDKHYASNPTYHLYLMNLKNENTNENMTVTIDNTENKGKFNSYIYADEVSNDQTSQSDKATSLVVSDKATLRLLSKANSNDPKNKFVSRKIIISHVDSSATVIKEFNNLFDSIVQYLPTCKFLLATVQLELQIQNYNANEHPNVEFHTSIPRKEFKNLISFPKGYNSNTVNLDLTIVTDTDTINNPKKLQFYNMMEYVYDSNYDGETPTLISEGKTDPSQEDIDDYNNRFVEKNNPHLFIPLYRYHEDNTNYYILTNFEVFPGYNKEVLINNFLNATTQDHITLQNIIPNLYIGSKKIQFPQDYRIKLGNTGSIAPILQYVVYHASES